MTAYGVVAEIPIGPTAQVYTEGWQSWSPTSWFPAEADGARPDHEWQYLMRFRPGSPLPEHGHQGEGLLVVDPGCGGRVVRFSGGGPTGTVPSIRAEYDRGVVRVSATSPVRTTTFRSRWAALASYAESIGGIVGRTAPRVWCSWYRYFEDVTDADILENVDALPAAGLDVDVVQVDDGWSTGLGEYLPVSERFGSLDRVADHVRSGGYDLGLWIAPFLVGRETTLAREHPDWLTGPAGFNWHQDLVGLDLTHPGVREYLHTTVQRLVDLGARYLKLDFLYGGAVPGERHDGSDPVAAYRSGLELIREAAGPETYLVGCGAPIIPSVGLVDAMRVSPDTYHEGGEDGSDGLRGALCLQGRSWQNGGLWINDPDCVVMRPSFPWRDEWMDLALAGGGLRSFSDRIADLDEHGLRQLRSYLGGPSLAATA